MNCKKMGDPKNAKLWVCIIQTSLQWPAKKKKMEQVLFVSNGGHFWEKDMNIITQP